jgi:hypothetical protein
MQYETIDHSVYSPISVLDQRRENGEYVVSYEELRQMRDRIAGTDVIAATAQVAEDMRGDFAPWRAGCWFQLPSGDYIKPTAGFYAKRPGDDVERYRVAEHVVTQAIRYALNRIDREMACRESGRR